MRKLIVVFLLTFLPVLASAQLYENITVAGRDVAMWKPTSTAGPNGFPVVVFSHGFGGCNTQSKFLMAELARNGYLVLAPNHSDARCGAAWFGPRRSPEEPFKNPESWSDKTYKSRYNDIEAILNVVTREALFHGIRVDQDHIGLAGHSLGGYTVLGLGGAWPSWKDKRVKAVLALSAYCTPYLTNGDLGRLKVPVMYQGGTRDFGVTPAIRRLNGAYERSSNPKYYVEFEGAGHFAWTDLNSTYQSKIELYSVAFFNSYLKPEQAEALIALTTPPLPPGISSLRAEAK